MMPIAVKGIDIGRNIARNKEERKVRRLTLIEDLKSYISSSKCRVFN